MGERIVFQELMLGDALGTLDETRQMYYRGGVNIYKDAQDPAVHVMPKGYYDFTTYFNSFSLGKWLRYTRTGGYALELELSGAFMLDVMGHFVDGIGNLHKEWISSEYYELPERTALVFPIPYEKLNSEVFSFQITAKKTCRLYGGRYAGEAEPGALRTPFITMATTTFKKETYIQRNIDLLNATIFADPETAPFFNWKIVDNGRTLDPAKIDNDFIRVIPNRNVGGSGGFCRGMLEALRQEKKPTHVLLMDDDVVFLPESFRRLCLLLRLLKPEYDSHFISGAMLEMVRRSQQHEDVGVFSAAGSHGPAKPRWDLNNAVDVVRNEGEIKAPGHLYSGWWYCCIPTSVAREDNLPLPFFIRGDDVEYSLRNDAKFITMNGICIWHEGFGTKFSGYLELYQVHRNDLILQSMRKNLADVDVIGRIRNLFWEGIYKFDYKGCDLLLDAVEDFLKGPEFLKSLDGEACMKEKRAKDNQPQPVTGELRSQIDYENLYEGGGLSGWKLQFYGKTVNGHRLPEALAGKGTAFIPYGWGYYQDKLYGAGTVYAIDIGNDIYVRYTRDRKRYRALRARYDALMKRFGAEYERVARAYRDQETLMESAPFWGEYLK